MADSRRHGADWHRDSWYGWMLYEIDMTAFAESKKISEERREMKAREEEDLGGAYEFRRLKFLHGKSLER